MFGTLVRRWPSIGMKPRSSTRTPARSAPTRGPFGVRPIDTSNASYGSAWAGALSPSKRARRASGRACNAAGAGGQLHVQVMRIEEPSRTAHYSDLAHPGHRGEAAGQLAHHLLLVAPELVQIDGRCLESHPPRLEVRRLLDHRGHVQQRLRWNATHVQAHAAERRIALDQDHAPAQVSGPERGRVATGARAENQHFAIELALLRARRRYGGQARLASGNLVRWSPGASSSSR